jgi:hypothetical protein
MAKRSSTTRQTKTKTTSTRSAARTPATEAAGAVERQVLAFAEQLGYVAGSIRSKAGGLMDRGTLSRQVSGVRDGAKHLLAQLAREVTTRVRRAPAPSRAPRKARSGGTVDAPGKKHRKPAPAGPAKAMTRSQTAKVHAAAPMAKTYRHRARG